MANYFLLIYYLPVSDQLDNGKIQAKIAEFKKDFLSELPTVVVVPSYIGQEGLVSISQ